MATVAPTRVPTEQDDDIRLWYWSFTQADTCTPVVVAGFPDVTMQVVSKSASCTVKLHGSLVPVDQAGLPAAVYDPLDDPSGTEIALTTTDVGCETAQQAVYAVRPAITTGTATAVVFIMATRSRR